MEMGAIIWDKHFMYRFRVILIPSLLEESGNALSEHVLFMYVIYVCKDGHQKGNVSWPRPLPNKGCVCLGVSGSLEQLRVRRPCLSSVASMSSCEQHVTYFPRLVDNKTMLVFPSVTASRAAPVSLLRIITELL